MRLPAPLWLLCLSIIDSRAATTTSNEFYSISFSTLTGVTGSSFAGTQYTYETSNGQTTVESSSSSSASETQSIRSTTSASLTTLGPTGNNGTATSSANVPQNTIPCNGYPQFCNRQYSNITHVCAHNSAFAIEGNAGSNQDLGVTDQLNDGIRMIQGETLWENGTVYNCHTTCKLLNAGPWEAELEMVVNWLERNPYDVVTWLIVNRDFISVEDYVPAIKRSGILPYLYEPKYIPQRLDQWPTLAEMILTGKRVVMFMDYKADQSKVPYILEEFTHMFETPFSPTNRSFPCTKQRPPDVSDDDARDKYMYIANHNLNTAVDLNALIGLSGDHSTILIPNTAEIEQTNDDWDRPPNFLLVDYYNYGVPRQGSVFEVAARANGVTYNQQCCGSRSAAPVVRCTFAALFVSLLFTVFYLW